MLEINLQFDPATEIVRICDFIRGEVKRRGAHGVVIGLSGGLDSATCACICARCLPAAQIHLFSLPERDSSPEIQGRARSLAHALGLPLEERDLSEFFNLLGLYEPVSRELAADRPLLERAIHILRRLSISPALFPWAQEYAFGRRRGFLAQLIRRWFWSYAAQAELFVFGKVRARMLLLSLMAMQMDCLLICTTDRSEYSIGFYDPHGDGVGDLAPLCHLYKTQIRQLAQALGVNDEIVRQPSSGDLAAGLPNETAIGLGYEKLDQVLAGLSLGMEDEELAQGVGVQQSMVKAIRSACELADERRRMPVSLRPEVAE